MGDVLDLRATIASLLDEQLGAVDASGVADSRLLMDSLEVMRNFKRIQDKEARETVMRLVAHMASMQPSQK